MPISWLNLLRWTLSSAESPLCCPGANCLSAPFSNQLSFVSPYHFRIRRDFRSKNLLSGFAPKQTKESSAWRATYIVLHMDTNKTAGEETRRKLHKNVESSIEQVLVTTPHETPTIRTLAPHHENYTIKTNQTRRTLLEKQRRAHKWCTPMDPCIWPCKAWRPARTYIQQLCEDTGCNPEDLPEAMNDREKWRETVRDFHAGGTTWWWWWWFYSTLLIR